MFGVKEPGENMFHFIYKTEFICFSLEEFLHHQPTTSKDLLQRQFEIIES